MRECIQRCLDCADICQLCARIMQQNESPFMKEICELCARLYEYCADECSQHEHQHCQQCADACRECAVECRKMVV
jgi:hypothetical protein